MLHRLAAIKIIRELELKEMVFKYKSMEQSSSNKIDENLKKEIIDLACKYGKICSITWFSLSVLAYCQKTCLDTSPCNLYLKLLGIVSSHTSYVAVSEKESGNKDENWVMQSRFVALQFTHGWHGHGPYGAPPMAMACNFMAPLGGGGVGLGGIPGRYKKATNAMSREGKLSANKLPTFFYTLLSVSLK